MAFDAVLLVSFGGPEGPEDVMPFLRNVVRGRDIPESRLQAVADQYHRVGGASPLNDLNRALVASLRDALEALGSPLPVYWGNRNWRPFLAETLAEMRRDGIREAAAVITSAYPSYSGCRQYMENIDEALAEVGEGAPRVVKIQPYFDRSGFVEPLADGLRSALAAAGPDTPVIMTAHSIPVSQAANCAYEKELRRVGAAVAAAAGAGGAGGGAGGTAPRWTLAFQSRSGPPTQPWLEPDLNDVIAALPDPAPAVIVVPIGFVSDHMEVVHDIDVVAVAKAAERRTRLIRTPTPGTDPRFAAMLAGMVCETEELSAAGRPLGPWCGAGCCLTPPPDGDT